MKTYLMDRMGKCKSLPDLTENAQMYQQEEEKKRCTTNLPQIISSLKLQRHIEGGYFKETYRSSDSTVFPERGRRCYLTSIFYMVTFDQPIGYFHINKSDIVHYFQDGSPIKYFLISEDGKWHEEILGPSSEGYNPQLIVPGGYWKASLLLGGTFGLIGEAVAPGFEYHDNTILHVADFEEKYPYFLDKAKRYIKKEAILNKINDITNTN